MISPFASSTSALADALFALRSLDPLMMEGPEFAGFVAGAFRLLGGLEGELSRLAVMVAAGDGWKASGAASSAHWLARSTGCSPGRARAVIGLGSTLNDSPVLAARVTAGVVSLENARQIGRCLAKDAYVLDEADLLDAAERLAPHELHVEVDQWLAMVDGPGEKDRERHCRNARSLTLKNMANGMTRATAVLPNEDANVVRSALAHLADQQRHDQSERTPEQRSADALVDLCGAYTAGEVTGGRQRPQVLVTATLETLESRAGRALIQGANGSISAGALRRLCCDANVHRVITDGQSAILDFGRGVRTATLEQYRALVVRDGGCVIPGCDRPPGWCQAHHWITDWIDGGLTDLTDLALVCSSHHHAVHDDGWQLTGGPGNWHFHKPAKPMVTA